MHFIFIHAPSWLKENWISTMFLWKKCQVMSLSNAPVWVNWFNICIITQPQNYQCCTHWCKPIRLPDLSCLHCVQTAKNILQHRSYNYSENLDTLLNLACREEKQRFVSLQLSPSQAFGRLIIRIHSFLKRIFFSQPRLNILIFSANFRPKIIVYILRLKHMTSPF